MRRPRVGLALLELAEAMLRPEPSGGAPCDEQGRPLPAPHRGPERRPSHGTREQAYAARRGLASRHER